MAAESVLSSSGGWQISDLVVVLPSSLLCVVGGKEARVVLSLCLLCGVGGKKAGVVLSSSLLRDVDDVTRLVLRFCGICFLTTTANQL